MSLWEAWEQRAEAWIKWARRPNHDGFWDGTWPELHAILPTQPSLIIDIGCGEGRVGRELLQLGHRVVGVERSATLARAARQHETPLTVLRADAARLPVSDAATDVAVACMSLHDVDDLRATVNEAWRVLRPNGYLCVALVHPFATAHDPETIHTERPAVTAPYLDERRFEDHVERDGLEMTFVSVHRPLSAYLSAFLETGFAVDALREFGAKPIPWLMTMRLKRLAHRAS
jgi:SAM-dependent methyltransferase